MAVESLVAELQRSSRGKIVMLVDNGVNGDSRVQKEARSMAAAGWDVVLLGKSPTKKDQRWQLGDAEVRLLHVPTPCTAGGTSTGGPCCARRSRTGRDRSPPTASSG